MRSGLMAREQVMRRHLVFILRLLLFFVATRDGISAQVGESKLSALDSLSSGERQARLVQGARAEGEAVIYLNLDPIVTKALTDGFMEKYPGVTVQVGRFSGASIIARVETEARAGKLAADVIMSGELGILVLIDKGVMARYRSPQLAGYPGRFATRIISGMSIYSMFSCLRTIHVWSARTTCRSGWKIFFARVGRANWRWTASPTIGLARCCNRWAKTLPANCCVDSMSSSYATYGADDC